jgi:hypothetical protein
MIKKKLLLIRPALRRVRAITIQTCLVLMLGSTGIAANWYVDKQAVGNSTGTDWTNAWTSLAQIAWPAINGGDTIYISGGTSGITYNEALEIGKSGSSNAPITIRVGQDARHNSKVTLVAIGFHAHHWITINGALSDSFAAPTNILGLRTMTNNIGIYCDHTNGPGMYMTSPTGIKVYWVGVERALRGSGAEAHGIWANMTSRDATDYNEIKYCWINNVDDDGIHWIGNQLATHFGHQEVAFCIIEYVGDDGMEANHGFTVHDCLIGPSRFINGHPDGIQSLGSYWKIYNNEFHDFFNSWIREQASQPDHHDIWIYNNLFLSGRDGASKVNLYNTGIEVVQYAAWIGELPSMTWSNIIIANNTFYNATNTVRGVINWAKRDENTPDAFVHNVFVTHSMFVNNLVVECSHGVAACWQPVKTAPPWGSAVHYDSESDLILDYNTVTGTRAEQAKQIAYGQITYPNGEMMTAISLWKHNSSASIGFVDAQNWDLRLAPTNVAAAITGTNLSSFFDYDILNNPRSTGKNWDRGAFQSSR